MGLYISPQSPLLCSSPSFTVPSCVHHLSSRTHSVHSHVPPRSTEPYNSMCCLYLTITVCVIGVLLRTVGTSTDHELTGAGVSMNGYRYSGLQKPVAMRSSHTKSDRSIRGVVQIHYRNRGMICSGALLTDSIVLTTADCARQREIGKTYVILQVENSRSTIQLGIKDIKIHPNNTQVTGANDVALLFLSVHLDRRMNYFYLPHENYTTDRIIELQLQTYVYQWRLEYGFHTSYYEKLPITSDYKLCGVTSDSNKLYYCVDRRGDKYHYKQMDFGTPIFYFNASNQYILGLFTGFKPSDSAPGVLYQYIYPSIDWKQIDQHPALSIGDGPY